MTEIMNSGLQWLFLDLNSYFASVEQQENPALRGRPVAVVPADTDYTCAIAASYEAKMYGIKTGTSIKDAKRLCPDLVCVMARHHKYVDYHHRILEEVIKHVPINKVWSIDELSSRLPARLCREDAAIAVSKKLKEGLRQNVGEAITCSIGLAPNSFLAKVATDMQKPDGLVILRPNELPGRLLDLKLTDLPGIGQNMNKRLFRAGVGTVEDLWNISPKHARRIWGSVAGERFWHNLHGIEVPDLPTKTSLIGHSRMLDPNLRFPDAARNVARRLTVKAATRLRRKDFYATHFSFSARIMDGSPAGMKFSADLRIPPSQDNFAFLTALDTLWGRMVQQYKPYRLKKVSVSLHGLKEHQSITNDLFDTRDQTTQKQQKKNNDLSLVMDTLNQKYGAETLQLGVSPETRGGYVGTKIAFSRIPDKEEFHE